jgi:hypothetical protein
LNGNGLKFARSLNTVRPCVDKGYAQAIDDVTLIANVPSSVEEQQQRDGDQRLQQQGPELEAQTGQ